MRPVTASAPSPTHARSPLLAAGWVGWRLVGGEQVTGAGADKSWWVQDISGKSCLCNFYGMDMTTDKLRSLVKKWQSTIECGVDVTTTDGYKLRIFCLAFTKKRQNQLKKTTYAQTAQIKQIRKKMTDIITKEASTVDLKDLVRKFIPNAIGTQIEQACQCIYPLKDVFIRKVKTLKQPRFDITKLMEVHGSATETAAPPPADEGTKVDRPAE